MSAASTSWALREVVVDGVALTVRHGTWDEDIAREVIDGDVYRARSWLPPNPVTIFDVGAHIGSFSCWMADRLPTARIFAFEMDGANQDMVARNIATRPQVQLHRVALGPTTGKAYRGPVQTQNTGGGFVDWQAKEGDLVVDTVSPLDFMWRHGIDYIDLLKLDCEGSEFGIVNALAERAGGLRASVGCVRAEMHGRLEEPRVQRFLQQLRDAFPFVDVAPTPSPGLHMVFAWR